MEFSWFMGPDNSNSILVLNVPILVPLVTMIGQSKKKPGCALPTTGAPSVHTSVLGLDMPIRQMRRQPWNMPRRSTCRMWRRTGHSSADLRHWVNNQQFQVLLKVVWWSPLMVLTRPKRGTHGICVHRKPLTNAGDHKFTWLDTSATGPLIWMNDQCRLYIFGMFGTINPVLFSHKMFAPLIICFLRACYCL